MWKKSQELIEGIKLKQKGCYHGFWNDLFDCTIGDAVKNQQTNILSSSEVYLSNYFVFDVILIVREYFKKLILSVLTL